MERELSIKERLEILDSLPPAEAYEGIAGPVLDVVERVENGGAIGPNDESTLFHAFQAYEVLSEIRKRLGMSPIIFELLERASLEYEVSEKSLDDIDRLVGRVFWGDPELALGRVNAALKKIEESKDQISF